jgi:hypothetical protein
MTSEFMSQFTGTAIAASPHRRSKFAWPPIASKGDVNFSGSPLNM